MQKPNAETLVAGLQCDQVAAVFGRIWHFLFHVCRRVHVQGSLQLHALIMLWRLPPRFVRATVQCDDCGQGSTQPLLACRYRKGHSKCGVSAQHFSREISRTISGASCVTMAAYGDKSGCKDEEEDESGWAGDDWGPDFKDEESSAADEEPGVSTAAWLEEATGADGLKRRSGSWDEESDQKKRVKWEDWGQGSHSGTWYGRHHSARHHTFFRCLKVLLLLVYRLCRVVHIVCSLVADV